MLDGDAALLKKYPTWMVTIEGHCDERGTRRVQSGAGRTPRRGGAHLPRLAGHFGRPAPDGQLRQGVPVRSRVTTRRRGRRTGARTSSSPRSDRPSRAGNDMRHRLSAGAARADRRARGPRPRRAGVGRQQGAPADRWPTSACCRSRRSSCRTCSATLGDAIKAVNARLDEQASVDPQGVRRPEAAHRQPDERPAGRPREGGRQQRPHLVADAGARRAAAGDAAAGARAPRSPTDAGAPARPPGAGADRRRRPPAPRRRRSALGTSPQRLYDTAWADYTAGQWDLAIQGFEAYIRTFPEVRSGRRRAGEDRHRLHEDSKYDKAVEAYDRRSATIRPATPFPRRTTARASRCATSGRPIARATAFEYVVKNYPDSDAGRLARQQLDQMTGKDGK